MSSRTKNKTVEELMATLIEDMRFNRITRADGDTTLLAILKKLQVTIEQNQKKIKEQQELIEHLWAWAEETDKGKTPSEADAEAYLNIMYPVEEETFPLNKDITGAARLVTALNDDAHKSKNTNKITKDKDSNLAPVTSWSCKPPLTRHIKQESDNIWPFDYRNFKLYDEYCGEKEGYTFLPKGPHGSGYYKTNY